MKGTPGGTLCHSSRTALMFSFLVEALSRNLTIILLPELFPYLRQNSSAALRFGCGGRARLFLQELSVTQGPIKFCFRHSFMLLHHFLKKLETTKPNVQAQLQIPPPSHGETPQDVCKTVRWRSAEVGLASRRNTNKAWPMPADPQTLQL